MRYLEKYKKEQQNNRFVSLQAWLRKAFGVGRMKRRNQINTNELHKLSHHLLHDLGFDSEAQPLCWSSYSPKKPKAASAEISDERKSDCQQHSHHEKAVG